MKIKKKNYHRIPWLVSRGHWKLDVKLLSDVISGTLWWLNIWTRFLNPSSLFFHRLCVQQQVGQAFKVHGLITSTPGTSIALTCVSRPGTSGECQSKVGSCILRSSTGYVGDKPSPQIGFGASHPVSDTVKHFINSTGFLQYQKVEYFYETFNELEWHKAKKQSPLIYMEKFLNVPRPKKKKATYQIIPNVLN